jgi:radical SAM protein with 4Fe4S-binding SPASM domain
MPFRLTPVPRALFRRPIKTFLAFRHAFAGSASASASGPVRVQLEITSVCTFDCVMCNRHNLKDQGVLQQHMQFDLFRKVIDETAPQYVTLSGLGDPVLYPRLGDALRLLRERGIVISLTSNLPHLTDQRLEEIVRWPPDTFSFSLHGGSADVFNAITRTSDFRRSVGNFERLMVKLDRSRTTLRINCALQRLNLTDHDAIWALLERWRLADHFHLMPVHDFGIRVPGVERCRPTEEEKAGALKVLDRALESATGRSRRRFLSNWAATLEQVGTGPSPLSSKPCMIPWYTTYITYSGTVVPCCLLTERQHVLGDATKEHVRELWEGHRYRTFRRALATKRAAMAGCARCTRADIVPLLGRRQTESETLGWASRPPSLLPARCFDHDEAAGR